MSQQLLTERYHGDEMKKDIHERNRDYLAHSRAAAEFCAKKLGWTTVHCVRDGAMRGIQEIHEELLDALIF